jgi:hypothetical protein
MIVLILDSDVKVVEILTVGFNFGTVHLQAPATSSSIDNEKVVFDAHAESSLKRRC